MSSARQHLVATLNAVLSAIPPRGRPVRVLDVGCGDGRLIGDLQAGLSHPDGVELYGFDIAEMGYKDPYLARRTVERLTERCPGVDWSGRIRVVSDPSDWGYEEGFFDAAVSNQVMEHVADLNGFLVNLRRALAPGATSVHLFPLRNCLFEGHVRVLGAHLFRSHSMRRQWLYWLNAVGLGGYRKDAKVLRYDSLAKYADDMSDFIQACTNYRTFSELQRACNDLGLSLDHAYTAGLYGAKLRKMLRRPAKLAYGRRAPALAEWLLFNLLKHASSSTFLIRRIDYDVGRRLRLEKDAADAAEMAARAFDAAAD